MLLRAFGSPSREPSDDSEVTLEGDVTGELEDGCLSSGLSVMQTWASECLMDVMMTAQMTATNKNRGMFLESPSP